MHRWGRYGPQDSLHADLAPLLELLATLEPVPELTPEDRYFCTDDGGVGFDLRLALPSGDSVSIPGDTGGCSTVRIGGEDVVGSDDVLALFLDSLGRQRTATEPASDLEALPLGCGSDTTFRDHVVSRIGDPQDLVGQTRWGDVVVVRGVCDTYLLSDVSAVAPEDQEFWYPSPEAQRILDGLRRGPPLPS